MKSPKIENAKTKSPKNLKTPKVDDLRRSAHVVQIQYCSRCLRRTAELEDVASDLKTSNNAVLLLYVIRQLLLLLLLVVVY
jgi:hypothetical protein